MSVRLAACCRLDSKGGITCYKLVEETPAPAACSAHPEVKISSAAHHRLLTLTWVYTWQEAHACCASHSQHKSQALTRAAWVVEICSGLHCLAEGVVSITFAARASQISLLIFGLDSLVEVASVLLVLWTLRGWSIGKARERLATGGIGLLLVLLACAATAASIVHLVRHETPESATPGLIIGCVSTFDMLCFAAVKRYLARRLHSPVLASDAVCSLACAALGVVLVIGSAVYIAHPSVWWIDAAGALVLAVLIVREGCMMARNALSNEFKVGGCC